MIDQKARELGRLIGQSDEYRAVKRANEALSEDGEAVATLKRMDQLRVEAQNLIAHGQEPPPEMEQELDELLRKVQVTVAYQKAVSTQENFDKLMVRVNGWISEGMKSGAESSIITLS
ncbi:MAG: YlbF family regulator [Gemmatimonadota bacterium]